MHTVKHIYCASKLLLFSGVMEFEEEKKAIVRVWREFAVLLRCGRKVEYDVQSSRVLSRLGDLR